MEENGVFPVPAMFMGKKGTKFIEEAFKNLPMDFGIRIDIICLLYTSICMSLLIGAACLQNNDSVLLEKKNRFF